MSTAVPQPHGKVFLRQSWIAGDYQPATVTLRAEANAQDVADLAELSLFNLTKTEERSREQGVHAASGHQRVHIRRERRDSSKTITGSSDWTRYEVAAHGPANAEHMGFEPALPAPARSGFATWNSSTPADQGRRPASHELHAANTPIG
ncbi:MAG TPA: hypothetical protein VIY52_07210 [Streptosporangiaceae bacterium]